MTNVFVNQKYHVVNGGWTNNVIVRTSESPDEAVNQAKHQFHAFMSTYGYGEQPGGKNIDYASCSVEDMNGMFIIPPEVDNRMEEASET